MRRLLHITTYLQGGAGRALTDLALAQHRAGHWVGVVASSVPLPGLENYQEFIDRLTTAGVPVYLVDSTFRRDRDTRGSAVAAIEASLPAQHIDIVHAHAGTPSRIGLALSARATRASVVIQTMHGWGTGKSPAQEAEDLETLGRVARVIVTSEASREDMVCRGVPREHLVCIPCGLEAVPPPPVGNHPLADEARARRARGDAVLLSIGSVNGNKNQRLLLQALPALLLRRRLFCLFLGEGPDVPLLEQEAGALGVTGAVRFAGYQPEAARWLPLADCLVQPSRSEGQGLAILEALRAGVPVVASDISAHRELVGLAGQRAGWLFEDGNVGAVVTALETALDADPGVRDGIVAAGRRRFASRYSLGAMIAAHERLYGEVEMAPRSGRP